MLEQRKRIRRGWNGRYSGFRIDCERVPMLPAWVVRRVWDDPRDIPYVLIWRGRRDGMKKEEVRIYRNPTGCNLPGTDSVEIVPIYSSNVEVFIEWRRQPHGGHSLLLRCSRCEKPSRALYGVKVGDDGRYYVPRRANWECRQCAGLRYSSEGGALLMRGGMLTRLFRRPTANVSFPRPQPWLPNGFRAYEMLRIVESSKRTGNAREQVPC